jgi:hypothetical protein
VLTEDSIVCEITGLCTKDKNFIQDDYSECIAYKGPVTTCESSNIEYNCVQKIVHGVLCSDVAEKARLILTDKALQKVNSLISQMDCKQGSFVQHIESCFQILAEKFDFPTQIPHEKMARLVDICSRQICVTMNISVKHLGITVKSSELKENVIALLYLMRTGIHTGDIVILPVITQLKYLLPCENVLVKLFTCRSKAITEIENKYKMRIRNLCTRSLSKLPFLCTNEEYDWNKEVEALFL